MPKLIFVKGNDERICIECNQVPTPGGGPGILEIPNVEIREKLKEDGSKDFDYLWFPSGSTDDPDPDDLVIILKGPLVENSMILPFNGGHVPAEPADQATELTLKLRK